MRAVSEAEVKKAVAAWLPAFGFPEESAGVKDLRGQIVPIAKFNDEETSRFFFPRRTLLFQQRMAKAVIRILLRRGAKIASVQLAAEDYARWLDSQGKTDTPELRFQFATRPPRI